MYDNVFLSTTIAGELYYGAENSSRKKDNIRRIDHFVEDCLVLPIDIDTAKKYAVIKAKLKIIGKPIPENDIWIAAISLQYNLPIATRDQHFNVIDDIKLVTW